MQFLHAQWQLYLYYNICSSCTSPRKPGQTGSRKRTCKKDCKSYRRRIWRTKQSTGDRRVKSCPRSIGQQHSDLDFMFNGRILLEVKEDVEKWPPSSRSNKNLQFTQSYQRRRFEDERSASSWHTIYFFRFLILFLPSASLPSF